MQTLTFEQLKIANDAGGVAGVTLKAEGGVFFVQVDTRSGGVAVLAKARSREPRGFGNPVQAMTLLRKLGLIAGAFDLASWNPADKSAARLRPDRAEALKRTHQVAEYDRWFREEVGKALAEADDPATEWVSHEVVKQDIQRQREALQTRIAVKAKQ
jgi:hypothetical protein